VSARPRTTLSIVKRLALVALPVLTASLALSSVSPALDRTDQFGFRIYDPTGRVSTEVTGADLVRSSVRAVHQPGGAATLYLRLTKAGAAKFHSLTRALARRGAQLHRHQSFAVEIGGHVYARPWVDYRADPDGMDGSSGLEMVSVPLAVAQRLAREIRGG